MEYTLEYLKKLPESEKAKWFDKFFESTKSAPCPFHEDWVCNSDFQCLRTGECSVG